MTEDNPILDIHIRPDWSEFDEEAARRERSSQLTFSSEGRFADRSGRALPGGEPSGARLERSVDRLETAIGRLAQNFERSFQNRYTSIPYRAPETSEYMGIDPTPRIFDQPGLKRLHPQKFEKYYTQLEDEDAITDESVIVGAFKRAQLVRDLQVYRGMKVDRSFVENLRPGVVWRTAGLTSWSTDQEIAGGYTYGAEREGLERVLLKTRTSRGVDLRFRDWVIDAQEEIITGSNIGYKVKNVTRRTDRDFPYHEVELEELHGYVNAGIFSYPPALPPGAQQSQASATAAGVFFGFVAGRLRGPGGRFAPRGGPPVHVPRGPIGMGGPQVGPSEEPVVTPYEPTPAENIEEGSRRRALPPGGGAGRAGGYRYYDPVYDDYTTTSSTNVRGPGRQRALPDPNVIDVEWEPSGGERGGGGGGFMLPPGGGGGGEEFGPPPFPYHARSPWAPTFWQRVRMLWNDPNQWRFGRAAVMGTMFGLHEAARASRAVQEADIRARVATDPFTAMQMQAQGIQQATGGIFGSIVGELANIAGSVFPGSIYSPIQQQHDVLTLTAQNQGFLQGRATQLGLGIASELRTATEFGGQTAIARAETSGRRKIAEHQALGEISDLSMTLVGTPQQLTSEESALFRQRRQRIRQLRGVIQEAAVQEAFENRMTEREVGLQREDIGRATRTAEFAASPLYLGGNLGSSAARENITRRQEDVERRQFVDRQATEMQRMRVDRPDLANDFGSKQRADLAEFDRNQTLMRNVRQWDNVTRDVIVGAQITSETEALQAELRHDPQAASAARIRGTFRIRRAEATSPQEIAALNQQEPLALQAQQQRFQDQFNLQMIGLQGSTSAINYAISRQNLNAQLKAIQTQGSIQLYQADINNAPQQLRDDIVTNNMAQQTYAIQRDQDVKVLLNSQLGTRRRIQERISRREYAGAEVQAIAGRGEQEFLNLSQSADTREQAAESGRNTILELQNWRQQYLEGFRGVQMDIRNIDVTGNRDTENISTALREIPAIIKNIEDAIKKLGVGG